MKKISENYKADYVKKYDPLKEEYELYDVDVYLNEGSSELVTDNTLSINDNIYLNSELLFRYEHTLNTSDTNKNGFKIFFAIIIVIGIMVGLLGKFLKLRA